MILDFHLVCLFLPCNLTTSHPMCLGILQMCVCVNIHIHRERGRDSYEQMQKENFACE